MDESKKTKKALIEELQLLRGRVAEMEQAEAGQKRPGETLWVKNIAMESSINAIAFADIEGNLTYVNDSFLKLWGYSDKREVLGKPAVQFWVDVDRAVEVRRMLVDGGNWVGELTAKRKDGSTFDVQLSSSPVKDEAGEPICTMAAFVDITERKQAEEKLKQYRFMVESAHDAIFFKDLKSRYIIANNKALEAFGLSRDQIIGKNDVEIMPNKEEARKNIEDDRLVFKTGKPTEITKRMTGPDGKEYWFQAIKVPQFDDEGNVIGLIGIARDITEHKQTEGALRESEHRFRSLVETSSDWVWEVDRNSIYTYASPKVKDLLGYEPEEIIGKTPFDLMPPDEAERVAELFNDIVESRKSFDRLENTNLRKDGRLVVLETSGVPILGEDKNLLGYRGIDRDITERKRAEGTLRHSENRYRMLLENLPQKIFLKDRNSVYLSCNENLARDLRIKSEEIAGKTDYDFFPKELAEKYRADDKRLMESGETEDIEEMYIQEGRDVTVRTVKTPVKDEQGNVIGILGIFWDITERKRAEKALRESEEKFRTFMETASDLMHMADKDGYFTYVNEATAATLGYSKEEMLGMHITDIFSEGTKKDFEPRLKKLIEEGEIRADSIWVTKEGEEICGEITLVAVYDSDRGFAGTRAIFRDITERKRAEEALQRAHEQLETRVEQRTADLAKAVKELQNEIGGRKKAQEQLRSLAAELTLAEERLRRRIAIDVHDHIGQNLAISKIKLESLRESGSSPELTASLNEISELIAQTIESSRSLTFELSPPVLYELGFEAAVEWLVRQTRQQHGLSTEFKSDGRLKALSYDVRVLLFQAVRELLVNVAKHANARNVIVSTRRVGDEIRVTVEDDGVGFSTSKANSHDYKTGGFGLFSIRERLRSIGGHFDIESKPGRGTCVTLAAQIDNESQNTRRKRK